MTTPLTASTALQSDIEETARAEFDTVLHQALLAQLGRLLSPHASGAPMHRYALVSAGQCQEGAVADMTASHELACERLFMKTPEAEMADVGPWLIEIPSGPGQPLLETLAQQTAMQALSLLSSPVRLPILGEHLRSFMSGVLPDGSPVLLRYFDPRIGFDMFTHWTEATQQRFAKPLASWTGWDGDFQPWHLKGPASVEIAPLGSALQLSAEWCQAMNDLGEAQLAVALLTEELEEDSPSDANLLAQIHPLLRRKIALGALAFAEGAGLTGWDNKALACRQALLTHARFYTHPAFEAALSRASTPHLGDVLAKLPAQPHEDWARDREPMLVRLYDEQARLLLSPHSPANASTHGPGTR